MAQFMCIKDCQIKKGNQIVFRKAGKIEYGSEPPNSHFVKLTSDSKDKDLLGVLMDEADSRGIAYDGNWDVYNFQNAIADYDKKEKEPEELDKIQEALVNADVKFDRRLGLSKLRKIASDNNLVW